MRCDIDIWICKKPRSKRAGMLRKTHGTYVVERFVELQVVLLDGVQRLAETNGGECVQREAHEVILRTPWSRGYAYAVTVGHHHGVPTWTSTGPCCARARKRAHSCLAARVNTGTWLRRLLEWNSTFANSRRLDHSWPSATKMPLPIQSPSAVHAKRTCT